MKKNSLISALFVMTLSVFIAGCASAPIPVQSRSSASLRAESIVKDTVDAELSASGNANNKTGSSAARNAAQAAGNSAAGNAAPANSTAGNAASTKLTSSDVRSFIDNYDEIYELMNEENDMSYDAFEAELDSYGISGPNRAKKVAMIVSCQSVLMFDAELQADPETARIIKSMGMDPMADMRAQTNEADMATVKPFYAELYVLFND